MIFRVAGIRLSQAGQIVSISLGILANVGQVQHGKEGLYAARDVHSCLLYLTSAYFGLFKLHDALCNVAHFLVVQLTFAPVVHVCGLCSFVESHR